MKKIGWIVLFCLPVWFLTACKLTPSLSQQKIEAERELASLARAVLSGNRDSVDFEHQAQSEIAYFIISDQGPVYWSDNSVAVSTFVPLKYDTWYEQDFSNARCLCYWQRLGNIKLLALIPLQWHPIPPEVCADSFSFRGLDSTNSVSWWQASKLKLFYFVCIVIILLFVSVGVFGILKAHGFKNMRLMVKIQYLVVSLLLLSFVYIFIASVRYVRVQHNERTRALNEEKIRYIQTTMQNLYVWNFALSSLDTEALNIDLRDLAYTYGTDIEVFDLNGYLIGSSTPELFTQGHFSSLAAPDIFVHDRWPITCEEQCGSVSFQSTYIEFLNAGYVCIGYIAIPSYTSQDEANAAINHFLVHLMPPYLVILLLALFVSVMVARGFTVSIRSLSERISAFRLGQKNTHIVYPYHDEIGELVQQYNHMVDELEESTNRLARSEREGAWRTMAQQIAHEINNPLTPMKLSIQQLQRVKGTDRFDAAFDHATRMLIEQIDTLSRIATSFSTFAKMPEVQTNPVEIAEKLTAAIALYANNDRHIPIRYLGPDSGITVRADNEQIGQVFSNIIRNALQALENTKDADIIVVLKDLGEQIEISISDNGPGIPEAVQDKIFMPNFTTKSSGSGLGLAISKNIVEGSGGSIRFTTSPKGTTFYILLHKYTI